MNGDVDHPRQIENVVAYVKISMRNALKQRGIWPLIREDCEDLSSEVLLEYARHKNSVKHLKAWLNKVIWQKARQHVHFATIERFVADLPAHTTSRESDRRAFRDDVWALALQISGTPGRVLRMYLSLGFAIDVRDHKASIVIADLLGATPQGITKAIKRAVEKLTALGTATPSKQSTPVSVDARQYSLPEFIMALIDVADVHDNTPPTFPNQHTRRSLRHSFLCTDLDVEATWYTVVAIHHGMMAETCDGFDGEWHGYRAFALAIVGYRLANLSAPPEIRDFTNNALRSCAEALVAAGHRLLKTQLLNTDAPTAQKYGKRFTTFVSTLRLAIPNLSVPPNS